MSLRHALLGLLVDRRASGYDLLKLFDGTMANVWPASQSQIYTELTKLAADDLITVTEAGPRGRKEYALTDTGLAELRHWLTGTEPPRPVRNPALLRTFFLGVLTPDQRRAYLEGLAAHAEREHARLVRLRAETDWDGGDLALYGAMALEWGLRFTQMRLDWATWALAQLPKNQP